MLALCNMPSTDILRSTQIFQGIFCENVCKNSTTGCFCAERKNSKCGWINNSSVMTFNFITQTSLFSFFPFFLFFTFFLSFFFDFLLSGQIILQSDFLYQTWAWLIVIIPIYILYEFYRCMKMTRSDWLTCNTSLAWKVGVASDTNWDTSRENMSSRTFDQVRFKPAWSATEAS